jgi:HPt (histidine-containing phosphotransfer) domain-containing protein
MTDTNDFPIPNGEATGIPAGAGTTGIIDWEGLKKRYKSNPAFVERIATATLKATREAPTQLRQWAAAGNLAEIGEAAHTLKGATGNLMANEVSRLAERVQVAARSGATESAELALDLANALDDFLTALAAGAPPAKT